MQFIFGPIVIALGILLMKYNVQVTNFTGQIDFAEKWFSGGLGAGTYTWWRLCGLGIAILGAFWLFGMLDLIGAMFASVLPGAK